MDYLLIVQDSIDYIDQNLKSYLTPKEIADRAGFSLFHYYRMFSDIVGISLMQFITKRKLEHAIYEISKGEKMIDVALKYGFNTHAGFFKAFRREYGCSPTQYLPIKNIKFPSRYDLNKKMFKVLSNIRLKELLSNWELLSPIEIKNIFNTSHNIKSPDRWIINDKYVLKSGNNIPGLKQYIFWMVV